MADENEQEQSVTSVWLKQEAGPLSGDDIFYLVQGTGSDRDRWLKLSTLSAYIASGGVEEMTLRRLKFSGNPSADTEFGYLELGCDITSWDFTYN